MFLYTRTKLQLFLSEGEYKDKALFSKGIYKITGGQANYI